MFFSNILRQKIGLCNDEAHSVSSRKSRSSVKSKRNGENEEKTHCAISRRLSSSMKTPTVPYFSKSKLQNVQKWLLENDVERIGTPPFANLSVTPPNGGNYPETPSARKRRSSSVDSEVEKVLVAVYGNDWRQKNVLKKCRTEPRKKPNLPPTKTDAKSQKVATAKKNGNGINCRSARRNILNSGKKNVEKDTFENLGVKEIDLNESQDSDKLVIAKNVNVRRKRRKSNDSEWSGCDSWRTRSNKKKKAEEDETPLSQLAAKLTPARKNPSQANGGKSAAKTPRKTFLASLSVSTPTGRCHPEAQYFKINFKAKKEELVSKLFKLYNCEIFAGKLPENMNFSWNVKLRGTAGFCYNKKITKSTGEVIRTSRVELSTKIVDRADRLRDTLIHELCHAASWVIDGVLDGHGSGWSKWAKMAMTRFPELPPIRRCHNYEIVSKYTYKCTGCGYSINRHSKSIDIERKRCGYCYGVLELFVNRKRRGECEGPENAPFKNTTQHFFYLYLFIYNFREKRSSRIRLDKDNANSEQLRSLRQRKLSQCEKYHGEC